MTESKTDETPKGMAYFMKRHGFFIKICSIILSLLFLEQQIGWAQAGQPVWAQAKPSYGENMRLDVIDIPHEIAMTKEAELNGAERTIINIQDAHASLGAQESIASLLDSLVTDYDLKMIALEGGSGYIDTSILRTFPDKGIRDGAARRLMEDGLMSAGEFFAVTRDDADISLYGIEDDALYNKNLESFREVAAERAVKIDNIDAFLSELDALDERISSGELYALNRNSVSHREGRMSFRDHWEYIAGIAGRYGILPIAGGELEKLASSMELERSIDFPAANIERKRLISELSDEINRSELEELVVKSLDLKENRISQGSFHTYLTDLAEKYHKDPRPYGNLIKFARYISFYESVDIARLLLEIAEYENALRERLYSSRDERKIHETSVMARNLRRLYAMELVSEEYRDIKKNAGRIDAAEWARIVRSMSRKYGAAMKGGYDLGLMTSGLEKAMEFYEDAETRNAAMLENTIARMKEDGVRVAALITGGFHTQGLTELMRDKKLSYMVVMPKFDSGKERPYVAILTGRKDDYRELLEAGRYQLAVRLFFQGDRARPLDNIEKVFLNLIGVTGAEGPESARDFFEMVLKAERAGISWKETWAASREEWYREKSSTPGGQKDIEEGGVASPEKFRAFLDNIRVRREGSYIAIKCVMNGEARYFTIDRGGVSAVGRGDHEKISEIEAFLEDEPEHVPFHIPGPAEESRISESVTRVANYLTQKIIEEGKIGPVDLEEEIYKRLERQGVPRANIYGAAADVLNIIGARTSPVLVDDPVREYDPEELAKFWEEAGTLLNEVKGELAGISRAAGVKDIKVVKHARNALHINTEKNVIEMSQALLEAVHGAMKAPGGKSARFSPEHYRSALKYFINHEIRHAILGADKEETARERDVKELAIMLRDIREFLLLPGDIQETILWLMSENNPNGIDSRDYDRVLKRARKEFLKEKEEKGGAFNALRAAERHASGSLNLLNWYLLKMDPEYKAKPFKDKEITRPEYKLDGAEGIRKEVERAAAELNREETRIRVGLAAEAAAKDPETVSNASIINALIGYEGGDVPAYIEILRNTRAARVDMYKKIKALDEAGVDIYNGLVISFLSMSLNKINTNIALIKKKNASLHEKIQKEGLADPDGLWTLPLSVRNISSSARKIEEEYIRLSARIQQKAESAQPAEPEVKKPEPPAPAPDTADTPAEPAEQAMARAREAVDELGKDVNEIRALAEKADKAIKAGDITELKRIKSRMLALEEQADGHIAIAATLLGTVPGEKRGALDKEVKGLAEYKRILDIVIPRIKKVIDITALADMESPDTRYRHVSEKARRMEVVRARMTKETEYLRRLTKLQEAIFAKWPELDPEDDEDRTSIALLERVRAAIENGREVSEADEEEVSLLFPHREWPEIKDKLVLYRKVSLALRESEAELKAFESDPENILSFSEEIYGSIVGTVREHTAGIAAELERIRKKREDLEERIRARKGVFRLFNPLTRRRIRRMDAAAEILERSIAQARLDIIFKETERTMVFHAQREFSANPLLGHVSGIASLVKGGIPLLREKTIQLYGEAVERPLTDGEKEKIDEWLENKFTENEPRMREELGLTLGRIPGKAQGFLSDHFQLTVLEGQTPGQEVMDLLLPVFSAIESDLVEASLLDFKIEWKRYRLQRGKITDDEFEVFLATRDRKYEDIENKKKEIVAILDEADPSFMGGFTPEQIANLTDRLISRFTGMSTASKVFLMCMAATAAFGAVSELTGHGIVSGVLFPDQAPAPEAPAAPAETAETVSVTDIATSIAEGPSVTQRVLPGQRVDLAAPTLFGIPDTPEAEEAETVEDAPELTEAEQALLESLREDIIRLAAEVHPHRDAAEIDSIAAELLEGKSLDEIAGVRDLLEQRKAAPFSWKAYLDRAAGISLELYGPSAPEEWRGRAMITREDGSRTEAGAVADAGASGIVIDGAQAFWLERAPEDMWHVYGVTASGEKGDLLNTREGVTFSGPGALEDAGRILARYAPVDEDLAGLLLSRTGIEGPYYLSKYHDGDRDVAGVFSQSDPERRERGSLIDIDPSSFEIDDYGRIAGEPVLVRVVPQHISAGQVTIGHVGTASVSLPLQKYRNEKGEEFYRRDVQQRFDTRGNLLSTTCFYDYLAGEGLTGRVALRKDNAEDTVTVERELRSSDPRKDRGYVVTTYSGDWADNGLGVSPDTEMIEKITYSPHGWVISHEYASTENEKPVWISDTYQWTNADGTLRVVQQNVYEYNRYGQRMSVPGSTVYFHHVYDSEAREWERKHPTPYPFYPIEPDSIAGGVERFIDTVRENFGVDLEKALTQEEWAVLFSRIFETMGDCMPEDAPFHMDKLSERIREIAAAGISTGHLAQAAFLESIFDHHMTGEDRLAFDELPEGFMRIVELAIHFQGYAMVSRPTAEGEDQDAVGTYIKRVLDFYKRGGVQRYDTPSPDSIQGIHGDILMRVKRMMATTHWNFHVPSDPRSASIYTGGVHRDLPLSSLRYRTAATGPHAAMLEGPAQAASMILGYPVSPVSFEGSEVAVAAGIFQKARLLDNDELTLFIGITEPGRIIERMAFTDAEARKALDLAGRQSRRDERMAIADIEQERISDMMHAEWDLGDAIRTAEKDYWVRRQGVMDRVRTMEAEFGHRQWTQAVDAAMRRAEMGAWGEIGIEDAGTAVSTGIGMQGLAIEEMLGQLDLTRQQTDQLMAVVDELQGYQLEMDRAVAKAWRAYYEKIARMVPREAGPEIARQLGSQNFRIFPMKARLAVVLNFRAMLLEVLYPGVPVKEILEKIVTEQDEETLRNRVREQVDGIIRVSGHLDRSEEVPDLDLIRRFTNARERLGQLNSLAAQRVLPSGDHLVVYDDDWKTPLTHITWDAENREWHEHDLYVEDGEIRRSGVVIVKSADRKTGLRKIIPPGPDSRYTRIEYFDEFDDSGRLILKTIKAVIDGEEVTVEKIEIQHFEDGRRREKNILQPGPEDTSKAGKVFRSVVSAMMRNISVIPHPYNALCNGARSLLLPVTGLLGYFTADEYAEMPAPREAPLTEKELRDGKATLAANYRGPEGPGSYGNNFRNAWGLQASIANREHRSTFIRDLSAMSRHGVTEIRTELLGDGRSLLDGDSRVGYDRQARAAHTTTFVRNAGTFLSLAGQHDIKVQFSLIDGVEIASPARIDSGVQLGGRAELLQNRGKRDAFIRDFLVPFLRGVKDHEALGTIDIINEPEHLVRDHGISQEEVNSFIRACARAVREHAPRVLVTVGVNTQRDPGEFSPYIKLFQEGTLDYLGVHHYEDRFGDNWETLKKNLEWLNEQGIPWALQEFGTSPDRDPFTLRQYDELVKGSGGLGIMFWNWNTLDKRTGGYKRLNEMLRDLAEHRKVPVPREDRPEEAPAPIAPAVPADTVEVTPPETAPERPEEGPVETLLRPEGEEMKELAARGIDVTEYLPNGLPAFKYEQGRLFIYGYDSIDDPTRMYVASPGITELVNDVHRYSWIEYRMDVVRKLDTAHDGSREWRPEIVSLVETGSRIGVDVTGGHVVIDTGELYSIVGHMEIDEHKYRYVRYVHPGAPGSLLEGIFVGLADEQGVIRTVRQVTGVDIAADGTVSGEEKVMHRFGTLNGEYYTQHGESSPQVITGELEAGTVFISPGEGQDPIRQVTGIDIADDGSVTGEEQLIRRFVTCPAGAVFTVEARDIDSMIESPSIVYGVDRRTGQRVEASARLSDEQTSFSEIDYLKVWEEKRTEREDGVVEVTETVYYQDFERTMPPGVTGMGQLLRGATYARYARALGDVFVEQGRPMDVFGWLMEDIRDAGSRMPTSDFVKDHTRKKWNDLNEAEKAVVLEEWARYQQLLPDLMRIKLNAFNRAYAKIYGEDKSGLSLGQRVEYYFAATSVENMLDWYGIRHGIIALPGGREELVISRNALESARTRGVTGMEMDAPRTEGESPVIKVDTAIRNGIQQSQGAYVYFPVETLAGEDSGIRSNGDGTYDLRGKEFTALVRVPDNFISSVPFSNNGLEAATISQGSAFFGMMSAESRKEGFWVDMGPRTRHRTESEGYTLAFDEMESWNRVGNEERWVRVRIRFGEAGSRFKVYDPSRISHVGVRFRFSQSDEFPFEGQFLLKDLEIRPAPDAPGGIRGADISSGPERDSTPESTYYELKEGSRAYNGLKKVLARVTLPQMFGDVTEKEMVNAVFRALLDNGQWDAAQEDPAAMSEDVQQIFRGAEKIRDFVVENMELSEPPLVVNASTAEAVIYWTASLNVRDPGLTLSRRLAERPYVMYAMGILREEYGLTELDRESVNRTYLLMSDLLSQLEQGRSGEDIDGHLRRLFETGGRETDIPSLEKAHILRWRTWASLGLGLLAILAGGALSAYRKARKKPDLTDTVKTPVAPPAILTPPAPSRPGKEITENVKRRLNELADSVAKPGLQKRVGGKGSMMGIVVDTISPLFSSDTLIRRWFGEKWEKVVLKLLPIFSFPGRRSQFVRICNIVGVFLAYSVASSLLALEDGVLSRAALTYLSENFALVAFTAALMFAVVRSFINWFRRVVLKSISMNREIEHARAQYIAMDIALARLSSAEKEFNELIKDLQEASRQEGAEGEKAKVLLSRLNDIKDNIANRVEFPDEHEWIEEEVAWNSITATLDIAKIETEYLRKEAARSLAAIRGTVGKDLFSPEVLDMLLKLRIAGEDPDDKTKVFLITAGDDTERLVKNKNALSVSFLQETVLTDDMKEALKKDKKELEDLLTGEIQPLNDTAAARELGRMGLTIEDVRAFHALKIPETVSGILIKAGRENTGLDPSRRMSYRLDILNFEKWKTTRVSGPSFRLLKYKQEPTWEGVTEMVSQTGGTVLGVFGDEKEMPGSGKYLDQLARDELLDGTMVIREMKGRKKRHLAKEYFGIKVAYDLSMIEVGMSIEEVEGFEDAGPGTYREAMEERASRIRYISQVEQTLDSVVSRVPLRKSYDIPVVLLLALMAGFLITAYLLLAHYGAVFDWFSELPLLGDLAKGFFGRLGGVPVLAWAADKAAVLFRGGINTSMTIFQLAVFTVFCGVFFQMAMIQLLKPWLMACGAFFKKARTAFTETEAMDVQNMRREALLEQAGRYKVTGIPQDATSVEIEDRVRNEAKAGNISLDDQLHYLGIDLPEGVGDDVKLKAAAFAWDEEKMSVLDQTTEMRTRREEEFHVVKGNMVRALAGTGEISPALEAEYLLSYLADDTGDYRIKMALNFLKACEDPRWTSFQRRVLWGRISAALKRDMSSDQRNRMAEVQDEIFTAVDAGVPLTKDNMRSVMLLFTRLKDGPNMERVLLLAGAMFDDGEPSAAVRDEMARLWNAWENAQSDRERLMYHQQREDIQDLTEDGLYALWRRMEQEAGARTGRTIEDFQWQHLNGMEEQALVMSLLDLYVNNPDMDAQPLFIDRNLYLDAPVKEEFVRQLNSGRIKLRPETIRMLQDKKPGLPAGHPGAEIDIPALTRYSDREQVSNAGICVFLAKEFGERKARTLADTLVVQFEIARPAPPLPEKAVVMERVYNHGARLNQYPFREGAVGLRARMDTDATSFGNMSKLARAAREHPELGLYGAATVSLQDVPQHSQGGSATQGQPLSKPGANVYGCFNTIARAERRGTPLPDMWEILDEDNFPQRFHYWSYNLVRNRKDTVVKYLLEEMRKEDGSYDPDMLIPRRLRKNNPALFAEAARWEINLVEAKRITADWNKQQNKLKAYRDQHNRDPEDEEAKARFRTQALIFGRPDVVLEEGETPVYKDLNEFLSTEWVERESVAVIQGNPIQMPYGENKSFYNDYNIWGTVKFGLRVTRHPFIFWMSIFGIVSGIGALAGVGGVAGVFLLLGSTLGSFLLSATVVKIGFWSGWMWVWSGIPPRTIFHLDGLSNCFSYRAMFGKYTDPEGYMRTTKRWEVQQIHRNAKKDAMGRYLRLKNTIKQELERGNIIGWLRRKVRAFFFEFPRMKGTMRALADISYLQPYGPHPADDITEDKHLGIRLVMNKYKVTYCTDMGASVLENAGPVNRAWQSQRSRWIFPSNMIVFASGAAFLAPFMGQLFAGIAGAIFGTAGHISLGFAFMAVLYFVGMGVWFISGRVLTDIQFRLGRKGTPSDVDRPVKKVGLFNFLLSKNLDSGLESTYWTELFFIGTFFYGAAELVQWLAGKYPMLADLSIVGEIVIPLSQTILFLFPPAFWMIPTAAVGFSIILANWLLQGLGNARALFDNRIGGYEKIRTGYNIYYHNVIADFRVDHEALSGEGPLGDLKLKQSETKAWVSAVSRIKKFAERPGKVKAADIRKDLREAISKEIDSKSDRAVIDSLKFVSAAFNRFASGRDEVTDAELHKFSGHLRQSIEHALGDKIEELRLEKEAFRRGRFTPGVFLLPVAGLLIWGVGSFLSTTVFMNAVLGAAGLTLFFVPVLMNVFGLSVRADILLRVITLGTVKKEADVAHFYLYYLGRCFLMAFPYYTGIFPAARFIGPDQIIQMMDNRWPYTSKEVSISLGRGVQKNYRLRSDLERLKPAGFVIESMKEQWSGFWSYMNIEGWRVVRTYVVAVSVIFGYCFLYPLVQARQGFVFAIREVSPLVQEMLSFHSAPVSDLLSAEGAIAAREIPGSALDVFIGEWAWIPAAVFTAAAVLLIVRKLILHGRLTAEGDRITGAGARKTVNNIRRLSRTIGPVMVGSAIFALWPARAVAGTMLDRVGAAQGWPLSGIMPVISNLSNGAIALAFMAAGIAAILIWERYFRRAPRALPDPAAVALEDVSEEELLDILEKNTNESNREHARRLVDIADVMMSADASLPEEYRRLARKLLITQALDGTSFGTTAMYERPEEDPFRVLAENGIRIGRGSMSAIFFDTSRPYNEAKPLRVTRGILDRIEGSRFDPEEKKNLKKMYIYCVMADSIEISNNYFKQIHARGRRKTPESLETPAEAVLDRGNRFSVVTQFLNEWAADITELIGGAVPVIEKAGEQARNELRERVRQEGQRALEVNDRDPAHVKLLKLAGQSAAAAPLIFPSPQGLVTPGNVDYVIGVETSLSPERIQRELEEKGFSMGSARVVVLPAEGTEEEKLAELERRRRQYNAAWSGKLSYDEIGGEDALIGALHDMIRTMEREETRIFMMGEGDRIRELTRQMRGLTPEDAGRISEIRESVRRELVDNIRLPVMMTEISGLSAYNLRMAEVSRVVSFTPASDRAAALAREEDAMGKLLLRADSLGELKMLAEAHRSTVKNKGVKMHVRLVLGDSDRGQLYPGDSLERILRNMEIDDLVGPNDIALLSPAEADALSLEEMLDHYAAGYNIGEVVLVDSARTERTEEDRRTAQKKGLVFMQYEGMATAAVYGVAFELLAHGGELDESLKNRLEQFGLTVEDGWFKFRPIERIDMRELREEIERYHQVLIAA